LILAFVLAIYCLLITPPPPKTALSLPALDELSLSVAWLELRLKCLSTPPDPPILYHYTDATGVHGILKNGCFWASAAEFSNDAAEIAYAQSLGRQVHDEIWRNKQREGELPDLEHFLMSQAREIFNRPTEIFGPLFFVSFCEDGDLLSQWRAYARSGYSLGFRNLSHSQQPNLTSQDFQLMTCKVIYEPSQQRDRIRGILEDLRTLAVLREAEVDLTKRERFQAFLRTLLIREIRAWFCCVKHKAFREESEWRIVAFREPSFSAITAPIHSASGAIRRETASCRGNLWPKYDAKAF
jgi:hypothetical protein